MKKLIVFLAFAAAACAQLAQPIQFVSSDPAGSCVNGSRLRYNYVLGKLWGCKATTWTLVEGVGGGDASTNTSSSVDGETVRFSGTGGKTLRRSTLTGIIKETSGVGAAATAGTDYSAPGTGETTSGNRTFTGVVDASGASRTAPMKVGTSLPGTCTVGDTFFKSDATAGQNQYNCTATNTWTQNLNSGGGGLSTTVLTDFSPSGTSTAVTIAAGKYTSGSTPYSLAQGVFTLTQYTISTISSASNAVFGLASTPTSGALHVGDSIYITGVAGTGCSGLNGLHHVLVISGANITLDVSGSGCTYTASSGTFGANGSASGTAYVYADYSGNLYIEHPAAAGLVVVPTSGPVGVRQVTVPSFDSAGLIAGNVPIATVALSSTGNGTFGSVTDKRSFMITSVPSAGDGIELAVAGGVYTFGVTSDVARRSAGNTWTGNNDFSGASDFKIPAKFRTHTCPIGVGNTNAGSAIANADLGPQKRICVMPEAATIVEIQVAADAGTPSVIVGKNTAGTQVDLLSSALATASSGGIACSKTSAVTSLNGVTTCSATLQNTTVAKGAYLELVSGTGSTAKWMTINIVYTVDN